MATCPHCGKPVDQLPERDLAGHIRRVHVDGDVSASKRRLGAFLNLIPGFGLGYLAVDKPKSFLVTFFALAATIGTTAIVTSLKAGDCGNDALCGLSIAFGGGAFAIAAYGLVGIATSLHVCNSR